MKPTPFRSPLPPLHPVCETLLDPPVLHLSHPHQNRRLGFPHTYSSMWPNWLVSWVGRNVTNKVVSFGYGHTYCNRVTCHGESRLVDICPECRLPVTCRVQLFETLSDVGGFHEQESAVPDVDQVHGNDDIRKCQGLTGGDKRLPLRGRKTIIIRSMLDVS